MTDLIERLQGLSAASREVDEQIQVAITPDAECMTHPGGGMRGSSFGQMRDIDWPAWEELRRQRDASPFYYGKPPPYTASIDSAMTLVPEGCDWLRKDFNTMTVVRHGQSLKMWGTHFDATGATPAIALCIAVLRACKGHEAQGEG